MDLKNEAVDLAVDWISRDCYTVENDAVNSNIMRFNMDSGHYKTLLSRPQPITSIIADPYHRYMTHH